MQSIKIVMEKDLYAYIMFCFPKIAPPLVKEDKSEEKNHPLILVAYSYDLAISKAYFHLFWRCGQSLLWFGVS